MKKSSLEFNYLDLVGNMEITASITNATLDNFCKKKKKKNFWSKKKK
jgi:hypothetical protein